MQIFRLKLKYNYNEVLINGGDGVRGVFGAGVAMVMQRQREFGRSRGLQKVLRGGTGQKVRIFRCGGP